MSIGTWIHKNLVGGSADYAKLPTTPDPAEQEMQDNLDRVKDQVDKLREPVDVSVEGGYKNLTTGDKVKLGAFGGAVVGAGLGAVKGMAGASAPFTVDPHFQTHAITEQVMTVDQTRVQVPGTTQVATANGLQDVQVPNAAIRYNFEPRISEKQVGEYKTPGNVELHHPSTTNAVLGAAQGAAIGAVGGVAITAGFMLVQHLRGEDAKPSTATDVKFGDENKVIAKTAAAGAVIGGAVGALDGVFEHMRAGQTQTVEWDTPVYHQQTIGQVPRDASIIVRSDVRYDQDAFRDSQVFNSPRSFNLEEYLKHGQKTDVQGQVPEHHLLGGVKMEHHSQTYTSEARYGVAGQVAGGVVLGGLVGVAAGVAVNVIRKVVNS